MRYEGRESVKIHGSNLSQIAIQFLFLNPPHSFIRLNLHDIKVTYLSIQFDDCRYIYRCIQPSP